MLSAKNISCVRNSRALFNNIHFSVAPGEVLQVVGNNGAGKSSLLRIAAGLLQPESGHIFWNDQLIAQSDYYHYLFYLGHQLAIKSELTVKENLAFPDEKIKTILQQWSLENYLNTLCGLLSQGQKQRVALARLQLSDKKIWILDEPFSNLDAEGVTQLERVIQEHLKNDGMVLIASHKSVISYQCELSVSEARFKILQITEH